MTERVLRNEGKVHAMGRYLLLAISLVLASPAWAKSDSQSLGVWKNPQNSVHVRAERCGNQMCGVVVWANDKAKADAKRGGTNNLVGMNLFRDFTQEKPGVWRGRVFVPDMNRTFSGRVTMLDHNRLEGRGCLTGNIGCRSQTWTRLN
ncbi:DUF2147 domain-containing protein [Novosphingobium sp. PhB165]|uniref:DUF2147 domain-containing protein n=1 Tax=Novosphingobium sp. PhB165 TaxID=2485105 RepID=UPI001FB3D4B6|nr:DUF2147 domain-containing protein [Novosphingobium sp. PhB165]